MKKSIFGRGGKSGNPAQDTPFDACRLLSAAGSPHFVEPHPAAGSAAGLECGLACLLQMGVSSRCAWFISCCRKKIV